MCNNRAEESVGKKMAAATPKPRPSVVKNTSQSVSPTVVAHTLQIQKETVTLGTLVIILFANT